MASNGAFNPDVGGVPNPNMPDQTGASKGQIVNRGAALALEGIGNAAVAGVNLYNEYNKYNIDKEVRSGFDAVNKPFTDTLPMELKTSEDTLAALQNAYAQGKISDVYYTGQLASLQKNLRAKYPQYEGYIDESLQRITGIRPANAYANAIQQEFAQNASDEKNSQNKQDQWLKENEQFIGQIAPDYFANPEKYDFNELRTQVVSIKSRKAQVDAQSAEIDLLVKQEKITDDQVAEAATQSLNYTVEATMTGFSNALGLGQEGFLGKFQEMATQGYSEEEYQQLVGAFGGLGAKLEAQLYLQLNQPLNPEDPTSKSYAAILGRQATQDLIAQAMGTYNAIKGYAENKEWGMMGYYTRMNTLMADRDLNTVLNASPDLRTMQALGKVDRLLAENFIAEAGRQEGIFAEAAGEIQARIISGEDGFNAAISRMAESRKDAATKAGGINALVDTNIVAITSPNSTPEQIALAVQSTYGLDDTQKGLFSYIAPEEYQKLYQTMYQPKITQAIVATGNAQLLDMYYQSAIQVGSAIPELRSAAKAIQDINDWDKASTVKFIPGPNTLVVNTDPTKIPQISYGFGVDAPDPFTTNNIRVAREAVDAINTQFSVIGEILKAKGVPEDEQAQVFQRMLQDLSVNLEAGKQKGFFEWLGEQIGEAVNSTNAQNVDTSVTPDTPMSGNFGSDATFGFNTPNDATVPSDLEDYLSKTGAVESGGNDNAKNPNSSASGRYQFTKSTYNIYKKRLGLTSDRNDPENQTAAMIAYTTDSDNILDANGLPVTNANRYALHFLGHTDGPEVLEAPDDALVSDYVSKAVIKANKFLDNMTVADFKAWVARKMA